jgi:hypothetical protein
MRKRVLSALFILLIFHVGLVIPKTEFDCSCSLVSPEAFSPCCNCPHCVSKRGGFLSACGCHEKTGNSTEDISLSKRGICFCGHHSYFNLPGAKYPVLAAENLFSLPILEIHHVLSITSTLSSQVYLTPRDHPS